MLRPAGNLGYLVAGRGQTKASRQSMSREPPHERVAQPRHFRHCPDQRTLTGLLMHAGMAEVSARRLSVKRVVGPSGSCTGENRELGRDGVHVTLISPAPGRPPSRYEPPSQGSPTDGIRRGPAGLVVARALLPDSPLALTGTPTATALRTECLGTW